MPSLPMCSYNPATLYQTFSYVKPNAHAAPIRLFQQSKARKKRAGYSGLLYNGNGRKHRDALFSFPLRPDALGYGMVCNISYFKLAYSRL